MLRPKMSRFIVFALWMLLIFVTSCFFIDSTTFVRFVQGLSGNPAFKEAFKDFWISYGLFVVKGWHATEYAIFVALCAAALRNRFAQPINAIRVAFGIAVLFAASDEWHQTFVPGRDGCVRDVVIDSAGAFLAACWLAYKLRRTRKAGTTLPLSAERVE